MRRITYHSISCVGTQMSLPERWPTDPRMICVCIALQEMEHADADLIRHCVHGCHHHIHATDMKMEDFKHEPLTMSTHVNI
jgi:hypothetical protein